MRTRLVLAALVLTTAGTIPSPAHATNICEQLTVDAPFLYTTVSKCVDIGTGALCHTEVVSRPPTEIVVTVCIPFFPLGQANTAT